PGPCRSVILLRSRLRAPLALRSFPTRRSSDLLHQRTIVQPAVEPVLIAGDVLLHRDVDEGLVQRDARHLGESQINETLHVGIVGDRKSTRLNSGHVSISYAVFCLKKKNRKTSA